jgi:RimJ/RimL family protein N-acetyltransferase
VPFDNSPDRPPFPEFITPRLRLRKLRRGDEEFLACLDSDPEVMRHIHTGPLSVSEAVEYARIQIEDAEYRTRWGKWIIEQRENSVLNGNPLIGWVELCRLRGPDRDDLQVGYELAAEHWGRGYASEAVACILKYAFGSLNLDRVAAIARPDNTASLRVLAKLRFQKVGERLDGGGHTCGEYRLTAEQWHS